MQGGIQSVIRFAHIDHLRLGSALDGLSDCPEWLRKSAVSAIRASTTRMIRSVIANRCDFLLIAGRLSEPGTDNTGVVEWLSGQLSALTDRGIAVVVRDQLAEEMQPEHLPSVKWLGARQWLAVSPRTAGGVHLTIRDSVDAGDDVPLAVRIDRPQEVGTASRMAYVAVPGPSASGQEPAVANRGVMTGTAGSPQGLAPKEAGAFGFRIVEADVGTGTMRSRFEPTDTIRFERIAVSAIGCVDATGLLQHAIRQLGLVQTSPGRTLVADITIQDQGWDCLVSGGCQLGDLLAGLRKQCRFGHSGLWPRVLQASFDLQRMSADDSNPAEAALRSAVLQIKARSSDAATAVGQVGNSSSAERFLVASELLRRAAG
jgi:hypothetical protein